MGLISKAALVVVLAAVCACTAVPALARTRAAAPPAGTIDLTISTSGDILIHKALWEGAWSYGHGRTYDFRPFFRRVRPYIEGADLSLCHLETPLALGAPTGYPVFRTPPQLARAIRSTGWDVCTTASNHTLDLGQPGVNSTIRALNHAGVLHAGSAGNAGQGRSIAMLTAKGVKVAFLGYTQVINGQTIPHPWSLDWATAGKVIADAKRARRLGAQVVIVNVHWGIEFAQQPTAEQLALAARLTRCPAITAVVGEHAHIVQPIRRINGKLVVFGQGNLIANQGAYADMAPASRDGIISLLRIRIDPDGHDHLRRIDYVPVFVSEDDFAVLPVGTILRHQPEKAPLLQSSWLRTLGTIGWGQTFGPWSHAAP